MFSLAGFYQYKTPFNVISGPAALCKRAPSLSHTLPQCIP